MNIALKTFSKLVADNKITLTNLALGGITLGLSVLLEDELFACPQKGFKTYGYVFLISPCVILLLASMMAIVTVWNPVKLCTELRASNNNKFCERLFKDVVLSLLRVIIAPIVWLIVSLARSNYYVCANVGPNPDKRSNLTMEQTEELKDMIESTRKESQYIAWGLFLGMVIVIFVMITLKNVFGDMATYARVKDPDECSDS